MTQWFSSVRFRLIILLLLFPAALGSVFASPVEVIVVDADLAIPLEGARVRSWDGSEYFCDDSGVIVLEVPDDRNVVIQASYPGYASGTLLIEQGVSRLEFGLRLEGVLEGQELVIEAERPGVSETRSGRSVAISGENLQRTAQIGLIEDVMTSIKLLPGVGYTGMFNALPSIRGGDPGDLMAVLDGFYVENPYHWGGGFSIFDPRMTESAQLSHGVFSARYGHTISGLLEVTSKKADTGIVGIDLGVSTSALNLNLSVPLGDSGGLMMMGKVTYWDPFIWAMQGLSTVTDWEQLDLVNAVTTPPYIRSGELSAHYRFTPDLELTAALFYGIDGVGVDYYNSLSYPYLEYNAVMQFDWDNLQTFFITGLNAIPSNDLLLNAALGGGIRQAKVRGIIDYGDFAAYELNPNGSRGAERYSLDRDFLDIQYNEADVIYNAQAKFDAGWAPVSGLLLSAGVQELFNSYSYSWTGKGVYEYRVDIPKYQTNPEFNSPFYYVQVQQIIPQQDINNQRYNSSAYVTAEYKAGEQFGAELGLRVDHLYFRGTDDGADFGVNTVPVFNPRLNIDYNLYSGSGFLQKIDLTVGTGLFSSMGETIAALSITKDLGDFVLRPNRSWTSVVGLSADIADGWSFNLEGYFKYVFDRSYRYSVTTVGGTSSTVNRFNGDGIVFGFDAMLQKFESRFFDGWITYTFTHAKYHEPESATRSLDSSSVTVVKDSGWYYPYFHRFHNINLVLNIKPASYFTIYTRIGFASGRPKAKIGAIEQYPLELYDADGNPVPDANGDPLVIKTFRRPSWYDENERTTWSIPWDLKLSFFTSDRRNKVLTEYYLAAENLMSLFYNAQANTSFNQYTGEEDTGSDSASYEMPIPMVSFGIRWSF